MEANNFNVAIAGEAGQGLVTIGESLARALMRSGYHICVTQSYMSRIRGGSNAFMIRAGLTAAYAPQRGIDLLIALNDDALELHREGVVLANGVVVQSVNAQPCALNSLRIPYHELADSRHEDMVSLGVAAALLGIDLTVLTRVVDSRFEAKDEEVAQVNRTAVAAGHGWYLNANASRLPTASSPSSAEAARLMLNGNEALALGAMAAGVTFCGFYPMTPATSLVLALAKHADATGVVVEQAEDEIAAINMALGAAFAGGRSMTATSGGGFALMAESVSLAAAAELPVVIVVAQRPGPATGLPTRTEQSDLEFVLHAGHGEFPRALLTPGSVESCFDLMWRAFVLADVSQGPVFVLTDQFLADSYRDVQPFDLDHAPLAEPTEPPCAQDHYLPYAITKSGVSPRLHPRAGGDLVIADSHEHTEEGHITEDPQQRTRMVDKRLRKISVLADKVVPPDYTGSETPDLLLISWGSSKGAVAEAAEQLRAEGRSVATLHFEQVWPLVPSQFLHRLRAARQTVCVEGNATRQFARLIRRETGFLIRHSISRYDGHPFTAEYLLERLKHE